MAEKDDFLLILKNICMWIEKKKLIFIFRPNDPQY